MSKAQWLSPEQVQELYPVVYNIFMAKPKEQPKPLAPDYPQRKDYKTGRLYAQAVANYIKERTVKLV